MIYVWHLYRLLIRCSSCVLFFLIRQYLNRPVRTTRRRHGVLYAHWLCNWRHSMSSALSWRLHSPPYSLYCVVLIWQPWHILKHIRWACLIANPLVCPNAKDQSILSQSSNLVWLFILNNIIKTNCSIFEWCGKFINTSSRSKGLDKWGPMFLLDCVLFH